MTTIHLVRSGGAAIATRAQHTMLALLVLAYQTLAAVVFVGATRYRVPTDFLIALLAAAVFERVFGRRFRSE